MKLTPNQVAKKILAMTIETSIDWIQEFIDNDSMFDDYEPSKKELEKINEQYGKLQTRLIKKLNLKEAAWLNQKNKSIRRSYDNRNYK